MSIMNPSAYRRACVSQQDPARTSDSHASASWVDLDSSPTSQLLLAKRGSRRALRGQHLRDRAQKGDQPMPPAFPARRASGASPRDEKNHTDVAS